MKENALPAVAEEGALTTRCVAAAGLTAIALLMPLVSAAADALIVCEPAVLSVAENVPVPLVSVELADSAALPSLELNDTVPL